MHISAAIEAVMKQHRPPAPFVGSDGTRREQAEWLKSCGYMPYNPRLFSVLSRYAAAVIDCPGNNRGLLLRGGVGIGKTFGLQLLAARFGWEFRTAAEIEGFYRTQPSWEDWQEYCRAADFFGRGRTLVIDDLGTETAETVVYGQRSNPLAELLEARYRLSFLRDRTRTLVSTNLTDEEIKSRYGYRVYDRAAEMMQAVTASGKSLRTMENHEREVVRGGGTASEAVFRDPQRDQHPGCGGVAAVPEDIRPVAERQGGGRGLDGEAEEEEETTEAWEEDCEQRD